MKRTIIHLARERGGTWCGLHLSATSASRISSDPKIATCKLCEDRHGGGGRILPRTTLPEAR